MAEAASGNMLGELKAITECSICTETYQDPRILPCIHTFCLKCMQQMAKRGDKKPGDKLSCPICRKEITIGGDEALGLQKNFFMTRLIEMVKNWKVADKDPLCNICLLAEPDDSSARIQSATMYCIDCQDNLCPECSVHHRKQKLSREHKVISLECEINEEVLLKKSTLEFCDEHKREQLKLFCVECKTLVCVICFVESHRLHDCRNVSKVADELRPQIIATVSGVSHHVTEMFAQAEQLENETPNFLTTVAELENQVLRRSAELKELVEKSTASVLEELSAAKKQRLKEIESKKEDNEAHLTILKTFQTYCNGIIAKGTDSDVCRVVSDLLHHADELHKLHQSYINQNLPSMNIAFQITKLDPSANKNIIGTITVDNCDYHYISGKESPFHPLHKANFKVDGLTYNCIEKYILHQKAVICNITQHVASLMKINEPSELHKWSEKLSSSFNSKLWESKEKEVVKRAYMEKSLQYECMSDVLCETKGMVFVYANRKDRVLGIGLKSNDPLSRCRCNWKGQNLLGEWLTEVQETFLCQQKTSSNSDVCEVPVAAADDDPEKFTFFDAAESPFSQWHQSKFVVGSRLYICAEQYLMHQKAVILGYGSAAQQILRIDNHFDLECFSKIIHQINSYDEKCILVCMDAVRTANLAKFGQNESLKSLLFETAGTTLVAADTEDGVWGIGLQATDLRAKSRATWKGENRLGQILTEVREELMLRSSKAASLDSKD